jgi:hypothetical protein
MSEGSEVLKAIRARIESPGHFIQRGDGIGHCAQDGSGRWVMPQDPRAVAFTIRGAFFVQERLQIKLDGAMGADGTPSTQKIATSETSHYQAYGSAETASLRAVREKSRYTWKEAGDYLSMLDHAEVLELLDRAIALEEEITIP